MAMIQNDWLDALKPEFSKPYYKQLFQFVQGEYSKAVNCIPNRHAAPDKYSAKTEVFPSGRVKRKNSSHEPDAHYGKGPAPAAVYAEQS